MKEKYFAELTRVLKKEGIETAPPENGYLPILLDGQPVGRVEPSGMMCRAPGEKVNCPIGAREAALGCIDTPEATALYFRVVPFSDMVKEYMTEMERAPLLHADGLDEEFRLLAEFNGTVLAGRETDGGYGMKFATWDWSYDKTGLYQGHYFLDNYAAVKEDFAVRAGLVQKERQFTDEQLVEMYRCMADTIDGYCELTDEQTKLIENAQQQIESAVPDLRERIAYAQEMQREPIQNM